MSKVLIAYFSANGTTRKVAERLSAAIGADACEIMPEIPYTKADLNWMDKKSRTSIEMNNKHSRPAIKPFGADVTQYDVVFLGFPIWWYVAPTIINTFLESVDLKGKTIIPFATSGGSDVGSTVSDLADSCPGADLMPGKRFTARVSEAELKSWASQYI